uniref:Uncharacterized protein n=1 Tax=Anopheles arabiensis TaxID=7173 RepID=A0A182IFM0_ANOAR
MCVFSSNLPSVLNARLVLGVEFCCSQELYVYCSLKSVHAGGTFLCFAKSLSLSLSIATFSSRTPVHRSY